MLYALAEVWLTVVDIVKTSNVQEKPQENTGRCCTGIQSVSGRASTVFMFGFRDAHARPSWPKQHREVKRQEVIGDYMAPLNTACSREPG